MFHSHTRARTGPHIQSAALVVLFTLLAMFSAGSAHAQQICHVAPDGNAAANASSWSQATTLHSALTSKKPDNNGSYCTEIRVKQGVYTPGNARADSFAINRPLQLKGGYTGTGDERSGGASTTVLSGDIDRNDGNVSNGITPSAGDIAGGNSYHLIVIGGTSLSGGNGNYSADESSPNYTLIDGFTITAGQANNNSFSGAIHGGGGGLLCNGLGGGKSCSPALHNLAFVGNTAAFGGAIQNLGGFQGAASPHITHTVFVNNAAVRFTSGILDGSGGAAGAIQNSASGFDQASAGTSSPRIEHSSFTGNTAVIGGALYNDGGMGSTSSPVILDTRFANNTATTTDDLWAADGQGGAIYSDASNGTSKTVIERSIFSENVAKNSGGAIYALGYGGTNTFTISSNTFTANQAKTWSGGAIYSNGMQGANQFTVDSSTFANNTANADGGAIYFDSGAANSTTRLSVTHSTFSANAAQGAEGWGGAIFAYASDAGTQAHTSIAYSTFMDNTAINGQSVLHLARDLSVSSMDIATSIFGSSTSGSSPLAQIADARDAASSVSLSIVQGGWSGAGSGNVDQAPSLSPLQDNGGPTRTMLPGRASAALDGVACNASPPVPAKDQRGVDRPQPQGGACDIGAVEVRQMPLTVEVTGSGTVTPSRNPLGASTSPACGQGNCNPLRYLEQEVVTLTATATAGHTFNGWSGTACTGSTAPTCTVTMTSAQTVSATFVPLFALTFTAPTNGSFVCASNGRTVTDTNAPPGCSAGLTKCQGWGDENILPAGSVVQCTATPASSYALSRWGDDCSSSGAALTCTLTMDGNKKVSALFEKPATTSTGSTPGGDVTLGLSGAGCALNGAPVFSAAPATNAPVGYTFPFGQIAFKAQGCTSGGKLNVSLSLPSAPAANTVLFKRIDDQWVRWPVSISGGNQVQYAVTDNTGTSTALTTGDNDPSPGNIDDPVLLAVPAPVVPSATPVPTLNTWALMVLGLLAAALGIHRMARLSRSRQT